MSERFYLPGPLDTPELKLAGSEAHHLSHVLRLGPGAMVTLFDGTGSDVVAEVVGISKRGVVLQPRSRVRTSGTTAIPVTLAVAAPKGDRFRWLVEKATELGVARLVPVLTQRSVVDPRDSKLDKLRQTIVAACKQSGRNHLMQISQPVPLQRFFRDGKNGTRRIMLHPDETPLGSIMFEPNPPRAVTLIIGPEGGFAPAEVEQAAGDGITLAAIGPTILRTETAAIAAAAVVLSKLPT